MMEHKFSDTLMEHFLDPYCRGRLDNPSGTGVSGCPGSGPYFVLQIRVSDQQIVDVRFQSHNCGVTVACGSMLSQMVLCRSISDCRSITPDELAEHLGGVPPDKTHVPLVAIAALNMAVDEASQCQN